MLSIVPEKMMHRKIIQLGRINSPILCLYYFFNLHALSPISGSSNLPFYSFLLELKLLFPVMNQKT